jgi:hypothetical protein
MRSMSTPSQNPATDSAARVPEDAAGRQRVDDCLSRLGVSDVVRSMPKDDDELNTSLCQGRFRRVVFADLDAVLSMLWKGHGNLDRWLAAGVRIELADPPKDCEREWLTPLVLTAESLSRWKKREYRRKTLAAALLSFLALLAAALLLLFSAR